MRNIYIVGFMGTGKTAVGKVLSQRLKRQFIEMDDVIEQRQAKKIVDIFAQDGELYFRKLEKELLRELSAQTDLIVSCGGGLICNDENLELLKKTGVVINLKANPSTIYERTKKHASRPLLNVEDPLKSIEALLAKRQHYYHQAHYSIETDDLLPDQIADKIIGILKKRERF
ncbi:MAG: shikimate kinase [Candidatus Omnitrophota bacterium]|nr:MAG: shikimate kinase [Candidatus Omnitrophota bacterium]